MAKKIFKTLSVPFSSSFSVEGGTMTEAWEGFFIDLQDRVKAMGDERHFILENNQSVAADIDGLFLSKNIDSQMFVDFLIQRYTEDPSGFEAVEAGTLNIVYRPGARTYVVEHAVTSGPDTSGVTFSITSSGQVQYTSTDIAGTEKLSRIFFRMRPIAGKSLIYSSARSS